MTDEELERLINERYVFGAMRKPKLLNNEDNIQVSNDIELEELLEEQPETSKQEIKSFLNLLTRNDS